MLRVELFGPVTVVGSRGAISGRTFPSRKARQVVALLGLARGRPIPKSRIIDQLWSHRLPLDPAGALEQVVCVLRRAVRDIDDDPIVVTGRGAYALGATVDVDLVEFERLLGIARDTADLVRRSAALERAVAIGAAPILADEQDAPWSAYDVRRVGLAVDRAAVELAELRLSVSDASGALAAAQLAQSRAPAAYDEAYRVEIAALNRLGLRREASERLHDLEVELARDRRGARVDVEALRAAIERPMAPNPGRRPVVTACRPEFHGELPLIGRRSELGAVASGAVDGVLVLGPRGSGRSRLLDAAAANCDGLVARVACLPTDATEPLLAANRVVRALARVAGATARRESTADGCVSRAIRLVERAGPITLLIDDLDLADPASVAVAVGLAHETSGCRLVASVRSDAGLVTALGARATTVSLRNLDRDELGTLGPGFAASHDETGGHPAALAACASAGRRDGVLDDDEVMRVAARFLDLDAAARAAVAALALRGGSASLADLALAVRVTADGLPAILAPAVLADVVELDPAGARIRGSVVAAAIASVCA